MHAGACDNGNTYPDCSRPQESFTPLAQTGSCGGRIVHQQNTQPSDVRRSLKSLIKICKSGLAGKDGLRRGIAGSDKQLVPYGQMVAAGCAAHDFPALVEAAFAQSGGIQRHGDNGVKFGQFAAEFVEKV